jgi:phosphoribosylformylglycinamidine cyclo-ligase
MRLSYKKAGVDQAKKERWLEKIQKLIKTTYSKDTVTLDKGYAGCLSVKSFARKLGQPVLVACCDGVGTKLKIAQMLNRYDTVGIDLVAMNVNDLITTGATPLFFLDYIATGKISSHILTRIMKGIVKGCGEGLCVLLGGETAEMPKFYKQGEYELAGFAVGIVDKQKIITGKRIKPGDVIIGIHSNGLHSNGYSLVQKILFEVHSIKLDKLFGDLKISIGEELIKPTKIYVKVIKELLERFEPCVQIKGIAHITGGGMPGNIPRILPADCCAVVNRKNLPQMPIFKIIKKLGNVSEREMFSVFNMGIGMVVIVSQEICSDVLQSISNQRHNASIIGGIEKGNKRVIIK